MLGLYLADSSQPGSKRNDFVLAIIIGKPIWAREIDRHRMFDQRSAQRGILTVFGNFPYPPSPRDNIPPLCGCPNSGDLTVTRVPFIAKRRTMKHAQTQNKYDQSTSSNAFPCALYFGADLLLSSKTSSLGWKMGSGNNSCACLR